MVLLKNQLIVGVKRHGHGITLYRTVETVKKCADLSIYCIMAEIEDFKREFKVYPEVVYIQADGGSENANNNLLLMLELLVIKRLCRKVVFTRLPTGHTHEDIDGCFGVIWRHLQGKVIPTLEKYKELAIEALSKDSKHNHYKVKVEEIMVLPDYDVLLAGCIDPKMSNLHREDATQHQWIFEAVNVSHYFQLGVKTTYRAYSADLVVEFKKKPKLQCVTTIGQYTGLEAFSTIVTSQPDEFADPLRPGIVGTTLFHQVF